MADESRPKSHERPSKRSRKNVAATEQPRPAAADEGAAPAVSVSQAHDGDRSDPVRQIPQDVIPVPSSVPEDHSSDPADAATVDASGDAEHAETGSFLLSLPLAILPPSASLLAGGAGPSLQIDEEALLVKHSYVGGGNPLSASLLGTDAVLTQCAGGGPKFRTSKCVVVRINRDVDECDLLRSFVELNRRTVAKLQMNAETNQRIARPASPGGASLRHLLDADRSGWRRNSNLEVIQLEIVQGDPFGFHAAFAVVARPDVKLGLKHAEILHELVKYHDQLDLISLVDKLEKQEAQAQQQQQEQIVEEQQQQQQHYHHCRHQEQQEQQQEEEKKELEVEDGFVGNHGEQPQARELGKSVPSPPQPARSLTVVSSSMPESLGLDGAADMLGAVMKKHDMDADLCKVLMDIHTTSHDVLLGCGSLVVRRVDTELGQNAEHDLRMQVASDAPVCLLVQPASLACLVVEPPTADNRNCCIVSLYTQFQNFFQNLALSIRAGSNRFDFRTLSPKLGVILDLATDGLADAPITVLVRRFEIPLLPHP